MSSAIVLPPVFSVIVATRNALKVLPQCIESFLSQSFQSKEVIVIDAASTDGTRDYLASNEGTVDHWISEPDYGISDAWNKGLRMATGEWIIFLGADDQFFSSDTLERVARQLSLVPDTCWVCYGQVLTVTTSGEAIHTWGQPWSLAKRRFRSVMTIPHQGVFHRRSLFASCGEFDISFRYAADYDLLLSAFRCSSPVFMKDLVVARMATGGLSSQPSHSRKVLNEFRLSRLKNGQQGVTLYWAWVYAKALIKGLLSFTLGDQRAATLLACRFRDS